AIAADAVIPVADPRRAIVPALKNWRLWNLSGGCRSDEATNQHAQQKQMVWNAHGVCSGLTTQAQRRRPRGAPIATRARWPGSLQRLVRPPELEAAVNRASVMHVRR